MNECDLDFLTATLHGRRARLAEAARLDELCRVSTVADLAQEIFPESPPSGTTDVQRLLVLAQIEEQMDIAARMSGTTAELLSWLNVRFQLENLKVLARGFTAGTSLETLNPFLIPLGGDLALPREALASAESIEDFIALLPHKPLVKGLKRALEPYRKRPRPFFLEAGLDAGYLGELLKRAQALHGEDRDDIIGLMRQEADTFHLMLAGRGRFHYGLPPETLALFHVSGAAITQSRFRAMLAAGTPTDLGDLASGVAIDRDDSSPERNLEVAGLETLAWERYWRLATRMFRRSHIGRGAVVAYLAIRRVELANLIRLSEGIRAGLDPGQIRRRLTPRGVSEVAGV